MAEVTAPPAPPAAAPIPPAPDAATAPDKQDVNVPELFKMLMRDVTEDEASGEAKSPEDKKQDIQPTKDEGKKPDGAKPTDSTPKADDAQPIKVRRQKKERPPLPTVDDHQPAPAPAAPPVPAPVVTQDQSKQFEEGLEENEREMLSDARYLEEKWPEKYKGMSGKMEKFLRDHIAYTERPEFDDQDPDYKRWLEQNTPRLSRTEIRQIEEARIADNLRKENDTRFADLQYRTFVKEKEPEIDRVGQQAYSEMTNASLPEEVVKVLREQITKLGPQKGYEEALKTHRLEIETAESVLAAAADDIKEFHRLNTKDPTTGRTMTEFANDPSNPKYAQHQRLANMVDQICEDFKNTASEQAIRDGKWFVTRKEWLRLRPDARPRFWTFNNAELIQRAKSGIKGVITAAIEQKHRYLKDRGWTRGAASSAAPATPPPAATPKAPPPPSPVPGNGGGTAEGVSATAKSLAGMLSRE